MIGSELNNNKVVKAVNGVIFDNFGYNFEAKQACKLSNSQYHEYKMAV